MVFPNVGMYGLNKNSFNQFLNIIGERLNPVHSSPITESEKKTMWRLPFVKIGFVSVVGSFLLMLSLLAFPATASAYSGNNSYPNVPQRGQLSAYVVGQAGSSAVEVHVSGFGFRPGVVFLSATENGRGAFVQPGVVRTNRNGSFSQVVRIQLSTWSYQRQIGPVGQHERFSTLVLHANGQFGQSSTQVLFLSQPYQGFQYGLIR